MNVRAPDAAIDGVAAGDDGYLPSATVRDGAILAR
jgi:hypothetical protein